MRLYFWREGGRSEAANSAISVQPGSRTLKRKRRPTRPRLITLRGILFVHIVVYIGAILYTWWSFVDILYRTGFIFNEADVPLPFHFAWTGALATHVVLTAALSLLNRWRLARKRRREARARSSVQADEARFSELLDEISELRESLESRRAKSASYRLTEWDDEPDDELILLEQYRAEREALKR